MQRLREAIVDLVSDVRAGVVHFPGKKKVLRTPHLEELARELMDFARIRLALSSTHGVLVDVNELALRLRETRRTVIAALTLLENQGRAKRTADKALWKLQVEIQES
jgi:hypothetical protein